MAKWCRPGLSVQFVKLSSVFFLILIISQVYAQGPDSMFDGPSGSRTAESEVSSSSEANFLPPSPTLRSEMPYFAETPPGQDGGPYDEVNEAPDRESKAPPTRSHVAEADGIPLLDETVVEGRALDPVHGQGPQMAAPRILAQTPDDSVVEDEFVDPFENADASQASAESRDPWESFNSSMFDFNYKVDRYVMKPVAKGYNFVIPPDVQNSMGNAFSNMAFAPRFLNDVFQGKFKRAGTETQRFLINTTIGIAGLFDVAKYVFDIEAPPTEDVGQTLAVSGVNSGPYLVLPFLPPTTVRDAVGFVGDTFLNPLNYFIPFIPNFALNVEQRVNERSINLETFEGLEESTVDLYGAVRSAYFERRAQQIRE